MKDFIIGQRKEIYIEQKAGGEVETPTQGSLGIPKTGEIPFRLESEWLRG